MKIGMNEISKGIEYVTIEKITKELEREGFIFKNESFFDLYAEKGDDKRAYELKIGKNKIQKKQFAILQEEAKKLGAKLYVIYLEIPRSSEIYFDGINQIIYEDLINDLPSEIDALSTHTMIESVDDVEINTIRISNGVVKLSGAGTINLHLQFGSNFDLKNDNGMEHEDAVDFFFRLSIDIATNEIIKRYYKIDIEWEKALLRL